MQVGFIVRLRHAIAYKQPSNLGNCRIPVAFLLSWLATAYSGTERILGDTPHGSGKSLAYDPICEGCPAPEPPWEYLNVHAPAPFVVVVDWSVMQGPMLGTGGRDYYLWIFGLSLHVWQSVFGTHDPAIA